VLEPAVVRTRLREAGLLDEGGQPSRGLGLPRCAALSVDVPGALALFGNQQGGVRVRCPTSGEPAAQQLSDALSSSKAGVFATVHCVCGAEHDPNDLHFEPPAAVAASALVVVDVDAYSLAEPAKGILSRILGPYAMIPRRVS
jgi:hypothetical protein